MGPKAGANTSKSRAHETAPQQTAIYTRSPDRRERSRPWRYEAKNAQTTAASPQRSKHNDISGPKAGTRHLKSRSGYEGAGLERNVIKLPKTSSARDLEALRGGVRGIISSAKHRKKNLDLPKKFQSHGAHPRVMGPMSPRIAARNAAKRHLNINTNFGDQHSTLGSTTRTTWRATEKSPMLNRTHSMLSYLSSSDLGKHYFSESMSPMKKTQTRKTKVVTKESPVDVAEKAREILRKGLDSSS